MNFFLVFIFACVGFVSCSVSKYIQFCGDNIERSPKDYEDCANILVKIKRTSSEPWKSMSFFAPALLATSSIEGISVRQEYGKFIIGLDNYLKRYALIISIKAKKNILSKEEKTEFFDTLRLVVEEDLFFYKYSNECVTYNPSTLNFIFTAIKDIKEMNEDNIKLVAGLTKYCTCDCQLELPLSIILQGVTEKHLKLPFINFSDELDLRNCPFYNAFIESSYANCLIDHDNLSNFIRNMIYGPPSFETANIFFPLLRKSIIKDISASKSDINHFIRRTLRNYRYEPVLEMLISFGDDDEDILKIVDEFERQHENMISIFLFKSFGANNSSTSIQSLKERTGALTDYFQVDPKHVEESTVVIYKLMTKYISVVERKTKIEGHFNSGLNIIIILLESLPKIKVNGIDGKSIEKFLDLLLNPLAYTDKFVGFGIDLLSHIFGLPYVTIDDNIIEKLFKIYVKVFHGPSRKFIFDELIVWILHYSQIDSCVKFEIFKKIHKLAYKFEFVLKLAIEAVVLKSFNRKNLIFIQQILGYSIENSLMSKSFILFTQMALSSVEGHNVRVVYEN